MFDIDRNGKIDINELHSLLSGEDFKDSYSEKQLRKAIAEIDSNGDGMIDFNEFTIMMESVGWAIGWAS